VNELYYVAFIVDHDLRVNNTVIIEAGVDLLAGPFLTPDVAERAIRLACRRHPRLAAFAGLATLLVTNLHHAPARLEVIPVRPEHVRDYNRRHDTALTWPPALLPPALSTKRGRVQ
jgi:hypothetical protein